MSVDKELEEQEEDIWIKVFSTAQSNYIEITNYFNYEPGLDGVFSRWSVSWWSK